MMLVRSIDGSTTWKICGTRKYAEEGCFEYMCAGIGQDVVLSISSGWCDVGGGCSLCVILYSMMILEC